MLNKQNFRLANLASKEESRYALGGILVDNNKTVVTDGHLLCIMTGDNMPTEAFPMVDSFSPKNLSTPFLVDAITALKVEKSIPKPGPLPILSHANVGTNGDNETPALAVTDLKMQQLFKAKDQGGKFPDYESCIPDKAKATVSISFNPQLMTKLLSVLDSVHAKDDSHTVTMYLTDSTTQILLISENKVTEQTATGVLMPLLLH